MQVVEPLVSTMRGTEKKFLSLGNSLGKQWEEKMGEQKHFYSKGQDVLIRSSRQLCKLHDICGHNHAQFTNEFNEALRVDRLAQDHKRTEIQEFPGSPMVRTWSFHCLGPRFNPTSHVTQPGKKKRKSRAQGSQLLTCVPSIQSVSLVTSYSYNQSK